MVGKNIIHPVVLLIIEVGSQNTYFSSTTLKTAFIANLTSF